MGLRLRMTNPKLAARSCQSCEKWIYIENGERAGEIATRGNKKVLRGDSPTPCRTCPKKSPEESWQFELNDRSHEIIEIYWQTKVCAVKVDYATAKYLGMVARIYKEFDDELAFKMWSGTMKKGLT